MLQIKNTQKITHIKMNPIAFAKCEIGGDWYKNELEIDFVPEECYPDYTYVQEWIMTNIDGKTLNIEDVVERVYNFVKETYAPARLKVIDTVNGCRTHFNVIVTKE